MKSSKVFAESLSLITSLQLRSLLPPAKCQKSLKTVIVLEAQVTNELEILAV